MALTRTDVGATARHADEGQLNVAVDLDAMADMYCGTHEFTLGHVAAGLGETGARLKIIDLLLTRSA